MRKIEKFVADDGKEFQTEADCILYENSKKVPEPLEYIDWKPMLNYAREYIEFVNECAEIDEDHPMYILDNLIETVYGHDIWTWIKNKRKPIF